MPAINVARTDTFEQQRVKINEISEQIFNITAGGSDLATGKLKIGDGSKNSPSLAFENDPSLGVYRANVSTIGYVSANKKLVNFSPSAFTSFQDIILEKNVVSNDGVIISTQGDNYDGGIYNNTFANGGTGSGLTLDINVFSHIGNITEDGEGYTPGSYSNISLIGGSGSGANVNFEVQELDGSISNPGSGYAPGNYSNVPLTSITGSGSGASADVTVSGSVNYNGSITNPGTGYTENTYPSVTLYNIPTQTFVVTSVTNPGTPPPANVYAIDGVTQDTLTLVIGNTYRFDVSDTSTLTHPLVFQQSDGTPLSGIDYVVVSSGIEGTPGAFKDFIIKPSATVGTIKYNCSSHDGMGASISVVSGSVGSYGNGITADIEVNPSGVVSSVTIANSGQGYTPNNVLTADPLLLSGGSGFEYALGSSFTYNGIISQLLFTSQGSGYEPGDTLSIASSNLGNVGGSGFSYEVTTNPGSIQNLFWQDRGSGYQVSEILSLPGLVSGVSSVLSGSVSTEASITTANATITVADTTGIIQGMDVVGSGIDVGTTVVSVDSGTTLTLSTNPLADDTAAALTFTGPNQLDQIVVNSVSGIIEGMVVTVDSGSGTLNPNTTVSSIDSGNNTITLSQQSTQAGSVSLTFTPPYGTSSANFAYQITNIGVVGSVDVNNPGNGYETGDELTIDPSLLVQPTTFSVTNISLQKVTFSTPPPAGTFTTSDSVTTDGAVYFDILDVKESGGNTDYILVSSSTITVGSDLETQANAGVTYTVAGAELSFRYLIDGQLNPSITLYVGNQYVFDYSDSSNSGHQFALSKFKDGPYSPSLIEDITATLTAGSSTITVSDTTGILEGMEVSQTSGSGIVSGTLVVSVDDLTTLTLSEEPLVSESATLTFSGVEYTESVTRGSNSLTILVRETTPNLYYYCATGTGHENEGGFDTEEIVLVVDSNNPKTFGSGALFVVSSIDTDNTISIDVIDGSIDSESITTSDLTSSSITTSSIQSGTGTFSTSISSPLIDREGNNLEIKANTVKLISNFNINDKLDIASATGNIETSGYIKVNDYFLVDNILKIDGNVISTIISEDIIFNPSVGRLAKVDSTSAFVLPVGTSSQRPTASLAVDGAIRYNSETEQYEGYNATSSSWSSLGGVRDLDGNTTILAEETTGANDNTLWFINDNINTIKFTPSYMEFVNVKKVRSLSVTAPAFTEWQSNVPVVLGQFVKYKNNLYEVTVSGTTGTSGAEPIHTSGSVANGTAELTWYQIAVAPITFEDYEEFRLDPFGSSPLRINGDLMLQSNTISTTISDLIIRPNAGKKVVIDSNTSLAVPVGADGDRGVAVRGSLRFNTTAQQFEGYDGTNWGSLGGVKDVDQNTYIIPELAPGSNENVLYFVNDDQNTLRLSTTSLDFDTIDTIRSVTSNEFEITASLMTLDEGSTTIDNTSPTVTFLHSAKQYFDIGLSAGLSVDPILRLDDQGDIYFNTTFGSGFNGVKIFDGELKEFELSDVRILSDEFVLIKGTVDNGGSEIYSASTESGAKTTIVAYNPTTNDKEFIELGIIDNGTDVFYTEYGNIMTGVKLIVPTVEYTANNTVRINIQIGEDVGSTQNVYVTLVSNITKK